MYTSISKPTRKFCHSWDLYCCIDFTVDLEVFEFLLSRLNQPFWRFQRLKLENAMLRQKLESFDAENLTNAVVEKLKRDNAILLQTLNQVSVDCRDRFRS